MSGPLVYSKKRMTSLRELMDENGFNLICLIKDQKRRQQYNLQMRLANTAFGSALIIPKDGEPVLLCTPDEALDARGDSWINVVDMEQVDYTDAVTDYVNEHLTNDDSKIGINPSVLKPDSHHYLSKKIRAEMINIEKTLLPEVFYGLYPGEIVFQRKASELADIGIKAIEENLEPGRKECEVSAEASQAMMRAGAESLKFHNIVSSGLGSARIHSWPGEKKIKNGDLVLVDIGPIKDGYTADISRTFLIGKDPKKEKMLRAVNRSIEEVFRKIEPGVSCSELDALSRRILKEQGYPDFPHGLGHSLSGFVVPRLSKTSKDIERVGSLHTVEPGVYIEGTGGVRIEENVVVTENGYEQLTKSPRLFLD